MAEDPACTTGSSGRRAVSTATNRVATPLAVQPPLPSRVQQRAADGLARRERDLGRASLRQPGVQKGPGGPRPVRDSAAHRFGSRWSEQPGGPRLGEAGGELAGQTRGDVGEGGGGSGAPAGGDGDGVVSIGGRVGGGGGEEDGFVGLLG